MKDSEFGGGGADTKFNLLGRHEMSDGLLFDPLLKVKPSNDITTPKN